MNTKPTVKVCSTINGSGEPSNYPIQSWTDHTSFPDVVSINNTVTQDTFFKIKLEVSPSDHEDTQNNFQRFSTRFSRVNQINRKELKTVSSIPGLNKHRRSTTSQHRQIYFPTVRSDGVCRIYVYGSNRPFFTDLFLKTAWLLNIFGAAGLVLAVFLSLRDKTREIVVKKTFEYVYEIETVDHEDCDEQTTDASTTDENNEVSVDNSLQDLIPSLMRQQVLQTRCYRNNEERQDEECKTYQTEDLPPCYSLLDIQEPPKYHQVVHENAV